MIGFLKMLFGLFGLVKWFRSFATPGRKSNQQVFSFWDGQQFRACDPIATFYAIMDHETYVPKLHAPLVDEGNAEATRIVCDAVRKAFGLSEWSEQNGGLTIGETLALYAEFCDYLDSLKKSTGETLTLPLPTEPTSTESSAPITSDTSASGVIDSVKKSDTPTEHVTPSSQL